MSYPKNRAKVTGTIVCVDCGEIAPRRGTSQKFCAPCSGVRDDARKVAWNAANGHRTPPNPKVRSEYLAGLVAAGSDRSKANRGGMAWYADCDPDPHRLLRVAVPFDWAASKNAVWRHGRGGHVYARKESTAVRDGLTKAIADATGDVPWHQGKVWVDIYVEKPNQKGDAVNVVDLVCDAIKDAIGVDDRWYSIRRLDWSIVKDAPRLYVGIAQEITEDHQACSRCGSIMTMDNFGKNKSTITGYARVCRVCSRKPKAA